jgi:hypothetical protein
MNYNSAMTTVVKKWSAKDAKKCIAVPSDLDNKYSRGVLGHLIEVLNDSDYLASLAATAAMIHANAAKSASRGGPISAESIIPEIQGSIVSLLGADRLKR